MPPLPDALVAETAQRDALARRRLPLLQSARIASPCTESWERMTGDDRVRFCGGCAKHVYDFGAMTGAEVEDLLTERGDDLCARFFRRADGTIMTSDCAVGAGRQRRRRLVVTAVAVVAGALGIGWRLVDREPGATKVGSDDIAAPVVEAPVVEPVVVQPEAPTPQIRQKSMGVLAPRRPPRK